MTKGRAVRRPISIRAFHVAFVVGAILSISLGLLIANLTGQYVGVFAAQVVIAGSLVAWYTRARKRANPHE